MQMKSEGNALVFQPDRDLWHIVMHLLALTRRCTLVDEGKLGRPVLAQSDPDSSNTRYNDGGSLVTLCH